MKSNMQLVVSFLSMVLVSALTAQIRGDSFEEALSSKSAKVSYIYVEVKGFASKGDDGKLNGLLVDVMSKFESFVSSKYGISINSKYVPVPNSDFQQFLNDVRYSFGGVFGLNTTTISEKRREFLKFSPPILNNFSVLITHKNIGTLSQLNNISSEFKGFIAYTAPGSTYNNRLIALKSNLFPGLEIKMVASQYDIINSVIADSNSFGFIDISIYLEYLRRQEEVKRHPVGDKGGEQYGIIMPLNSDWDPVITEFLNSGFLKSPIYRQIVIDNLGKGALRMLD